MGKFSFFSFEWLSSRERQQKKEEQQVKLVELALKEKELEKENKPQKGDELQKEFMEQVLAAPTKPYKSVRVIGRTCMVVLNDGTTLSGEAELIGHVRQAQNEEEIIELFTKTEKPDRQEEKEEHALVVANMEILRGHEDFEIKGQNVYLKGVSLVIPPIVLASFIEVLEGIKYEVADATEFIKQYDALKMFWYWAALNPIESSRRSLLEFVRKNDITITTNGLLLMYRRVVKKKGKGNHELIQFISNQYSKVKRWKKSPKNYWIWAEDDGTYKLIDYNAKGDGIGINEGNLETLYLDLPNMQTFSYTDNHTHSKDIKIGEIYKEDEEKIDLDNSRSCSSGLHVGSRAFGFSGFGDVGVIALVNPMFVRSVPNHECEKMRVSEMFIAAVAELDEYSELVEDGAILDFSEEYCSHSIEEIEEMLKEKKIDKVSCQGNFPAVSVIDIEKIKGMLKDRIVKI